MNIDSLLNVFKAEYIRELARDKYKAEKDANKKKKQFNQKLAESILLLTALFILYLMLRPFIN